MTVLASGPEEARKVQALVIRKGLEACKIGLRLNTAYTPTALMRTASNITGQKFKRGDYDSAIAALTEFTGVPSAKKTA